MTIQTLQEFQAQFSMDVAEVEIPEFGKESAFTVYLKPLSAEQRDEFEASVIGIKGKTNMHNLRARLVQKAWVNAEGAPIGTPAQVGSQRADVINAIFEVVRSRNGMDKDVAKAEEEKND